MEREEENKEIREGGTSAWSCVFLATYISKREDKTAGKNERQKRETGKKGGREANKTHTHTQRTNQHKN
jgi:hypothetical protein